MPHSRAARATSLLQAFRVAALGSWALVVGCSAGPSPEVAAAPSATCAIVAQGTLPPASITVATASPIDPRHLPRATNYAERFAFAQAYETLVNIDCNGHAYAGLARSWNVDATKARVTFTLRDGARFSTGEPLSARDVVVGWRATAQGPTIAAQLAGRIADATTVVDERTLTVSLSDTAWHVLADPSLSVYRAVPGASWPAGTGQYRVADSMSYDSAGTLTMLPVHQGTAPRLVVRIRGSADLRDAIDAGADLVPEAGPVALSYATSRAPLVSTPLPWDQTYVLAIPVFVPRDTVALEPVIGDHAAAVLTSFARDAVRADARGATPPYWWTDVQACDMGTLGGRPRPRAEQRPLRIVYDASDAVARGLAERLVALGTRAVSLPFTHDDFVRALRDGSEAAYVISVRRASLAPCHDAAMLVTDAPWLRPLVGGGPISPPPKLVPLVDTRAHAIINRDRISATLDWDGTLKITTPERRP